MRSISMKEHQKFLRAAAVLVLMLLMDAPMTSTFRTAGSTKYCRVSVPASRQLPPKATGPVLRAGSTALQFALLPTAASAAAVAGVVAFHEAGHFLAAKWQGMKIQSFNIGYGPKVFSFNDTSDTEFALRALPLGGFVAFPANVEYDDEGNEIQELTDPDLLQNRPPLQRALVISGGVLANVLLTFLLSTGTAISSGLGTPLYDNGIQVTSMLDAASPAYEAGIRTNDIITQVNHEPILGSETAVESFVTKVRSSLNQPLELEIVRTSSSAEGAGQSRQVFETKVTPRTTPKGKVSIGIGINAMVKEVKNTRASNPIEAIQLGYYQTEKLFSFTWNSLTRAVTNGFVGNELDGPISVVKTGAQMAEYSPTALAGFAAALSVNLAIINSLPFPALDGGQLAFVVVEVLAQRPVPRRVQEVITGVAFSLLLVFGASTIIGDIDKLSDPLLPAKVKVSGTMPGMPSSSSK